MKESNGICSPIRIELRLHTTGEARRIEDELIQMMAYEIKAFTAAATIIMTFFFFLIGKTFFFFLLPQWNCSSSKDKTGLLSFTKEQS